MKLMKILSISNALPPSKSPLRLALLILLLPGDLPAQDRPPGTARGPGCPQGSVVITSTPGPGSISYELKYQKLHAESSSKRHMDRKNCGASIPIQLTNTHRLLITRIEAQGESGGLAGRGKIRVEAFESGGKAPPLEIDLPKKADGGITVFRHSLDEPYRGRCGSNGLLRVDASLWVEAQHSFSAKIDRVAITVRKEPCAGSDARSKLPQPRTR